MKNYKQFLLEHYYTDAKLWKGTKALTEKETIKLLQTECLDYFDYNLDKLILRYSQMGGMKYIYTDPQKFNRKSSNTSNYYTLIMNNDPSWEHLPKRKLSCSHTEIDSDEVKDRGNEDVYVVVPFDGNVWGVCPKIDMWDSIKNLGDKRLDHLNRQLEDIADYLQMRLRDDNIKNFKEDLKEIDLELKNADDINYDHFDNLVYNFKDSGDIYQYLVDLLEPNKNNIKLLSTREVYNMTGKDKEVWTEGKCLMIQVDEYERITK